MLPNERSYTVAFLIFLRLCDWIFVAENEHEVRNFDQFGSLPENDKSKKKLRNFLGISSYLLNIQYYLLEILNYSEGLTEALRSFTRLPFAVVSYQSSLSEALLFFLFSTHSMHFIIFFNGVTCWYAGICYVCWVWVWKMEKKGQTGLMGSKVNRG